MAVSDGAVGEARDAEVGQFGSLPAAAPPAARADQDVVGLDVAVDHPRRMGVGERRAEVGPQLGDLAVGELPARGEASHVRALDQLGHQVRAAALATELVEGDDARVVEPGRGVGLAHDSLDRLALDGLDGDRAAEPLVPGAVDYAVPTAADPLADREPSQNALALDHRGENSPCREAVLPQG